MFLILRHVSIVLALLVCLPTSALALDGNLTQNRIRALNNYAEKNIKVASDLVNQLHKEKSALALKITSEPRLPQYSWTGQERDDEVGLSYHSARYFGTRSGRWQKPDILYITSSEESLKRPLEAMSGYQYAMGNPVNGVDPGGHALSLVMAM